MYKLEFTLKQHTPIIHFQHDQEGATLRVTEVKPKLDRFIIEKCKEQNIDYKKWLIGNGEHDALNYKIRIDRPLDTFYFLPLALNLKPNKEKNLIAYIKEQSKINVLLIAPSPYFANSDKIKWQRKPNDDQIDITKTKVSDLKFAIISKNEINVCINTVYIDLKKIIEENTTLFFFLNSFGTRQNKGFGSFMTIDVPQINKDTLNNIPISFGIEGLYSKKYTGLNIQTSFSEINTFWKILKAGNSYGGYQKSDLFNYFYNLTPKIRWEKRAIKTNMKARFNDIFNQLKYNTENNKNRILTETDTDSNHFFVRALLGLAENNEFGTFNSRDKVKILISDKLSKEKTTKEKAVDRFQSPIYFKIIDNTIYMLVYKINHLLQTDIDGNDREFEFKINASINRDETTEILTTLKIPKNVSIVEFLDSDKYITSSGLVKKDLINNTTSIAKDFGFTKI